MIRRLLCKTLGIVAGLSLTMSSVVYAAMPDNSDKSVVIPITYSTGDFTVSVNEDDAVGLGMTLMNNQSNLTDAFLTDSDWDSLQDNRNIHIDVDFTVLDYDSIKDIIQPVISVDDAQKRWVFDITVKKTGVSQEIMSSVFDDLVFEFDAPDDFDPNYMDKAKLIAVHQVNETTYQVEFLELQYNTSTKKLGFKTKMFSPYMLLYNPVKSSEDKPSDGGTDKPSEQGGNSEPAPAPTPDSGGSEPQNPSVTPSPSPTPAPTPVTPTQSDTTTPSSDSDDKKPADTDNKSTIPDNSDKPSLNDRSDVPIPNNRPNNNYGGFDNNNGMSIWDNLLLWTHLRSSDWHTETEDNTNKSDGNNNVTSRDSSSNSGVDSSGNINSLYGSTSGTGGVGFSSDDNIITNGSDGTTGTSVDVTQVRDGSYITGDSATYYKIRIAIIAGCSALIVLILVVALVKRKKS